MRSSRLLVFAAALVPLLGSLLLGCPRPPDERTGEACLGFTECGECVGQPQCGWCIEGGAGTCIPNQGETDPSTPPPSCSGEGQSWRYRIPDDPALPDGAPYCPRLSATGEPLEEAAPETTGDEAGGEETGGDEAGGDETFGEEPMPEEGT